MRDARLPPRPPSLPRTPPGSFAFKYLLVLVVGPVMMLACCGFAIYDARRGYDLNLFVQCLSIAAMCWSTARLYRSEFHCWRVWARLRREHDLLLDGLDALAVAHLDMAERGLETELDERIAAFDARIDSIRMLAGRN